MKLSSLIAMEYVGVPYIYGGNNPMTGLDCSGFVQLVLKKLGIIEDNMDRTAQDIYNLLVKKLALNSSVKGDCVLCFGKGPDQISHIAISIDDEWMIEAAPGDASVVTIKDAVARCARVQFNKISRRKDLVACLYLDTKTI